jgi:hypothetical protein
VEIGGTDRAYPAKPRPDDGKRSAADSARACMLSVAGFSSRTTKVLRIRVSEAARRSSLLEGAYGRARLLMRYSLPHPPNELEPSRSE